MQAGTVKPLRVFWSYSHRDEALRDELHEHLAGLRRAGLIDDWHDRKIDAGTVWKDEIDRHLGDADIVLLLISASFIASEYCWGDEMAKALARHEKDEARVIPVILRPCDWLDTPIARLQAVPKDARPITQWADRDVAYLDITAAIRLAVRELVEARARPEPPAPAATVPPATRQPAAPHPDPLPQAGEGDARPRTGEGAAGDAQVPSPATAGEGGARRESDGRVRAVPKNGVYIGVDASTLPDLAVFKDSDLPWLPEMVVIPAGSFLMGSPEEEAGHDAREAPRHQVTIGKRFALGKYAVTFNEYDHFCEATNREMLEDHWGRDRQPVVDISWRDAIAYVKWLCGETGQPYRLPTEEEWEYACRAGTTTPFWFGRTVTREQANYERKKTVPVGTHPASPWGLHEMHGNIWEWVKDAWHADYSNAPVDGSARMIEETTTPSRRVVRGGSWSCGNPCDLRSAFRLTFWSNERTNEVGFRLARTLF